MKSSPLSQKHVLSNQRMTFKDRGKIKVAVNNLIPSVPELEIFHLCEQSLDIIIDQNCDHKEERLSL